MITEVKKQRLAIDQIENLRDILRRQQRREVTPDEATEIGESLIDFFELLAISRHRTAEAGA
jgi:hypothetical protein